MIGAQSGAVAARDDADLLAPDALHGRGGEKIDLALDFGGRREGVAAENLTDVVGAVLVAETPQVVGAHLHRAGQVQEFQVVEACVSVGLAKIGNQILPIVASEGFPEAVVASYVPQAHHGRFLIGLELVLHGPKGLANPQIELAFHAVLVGVQGDGRVYGDDDEGNEKKHSEYFFLNAHKPSQMLAFIFIAGTIFLIFPDIGGRFSTL